MNPSEASTTSQIERWASRQLADYDACQPGTMFADGVVLDMIQAYQIQLAVAKLRCGRGEQVVGYKVGCTSPKIRAQLGIDHCVTGRLYDSEQHTSGKELSRAKYANLAIEGELAVELSHKPTEPDFLEPGIPACVARVFPVIELHNYVMRGEQPSASELIAHNALHAGFVAGRGISPQAADGEPSLAILMNDQLLEECAGFPLIQTIHSSLKWLMETVRDRDDQLAAGQIVLTGSLPSLIPIYKDGHISVDAPPFGKVEVNLTT
ncbi:MAG: hypothetical protein GY903_01650 [Fuerstiella sp.]|nr:hypothetical protein [Fuerstiella sp.]MCP4853182.1 hypothetical protein [Fuerstiella sp.]